MSVWGCCACAWFSSLHNWSCDVLYSERLFETQNLVCSLNQNFTYNGVERCTPILKSWAVPGSAGIFTVVILCCQGKKVLMSLTSIRMQRNLPPTSGNIGYLIKDKTYYINIVCFHSKLLFTKSNILSNWYIFRIMQFLAPEWYSTLENLLLRVWRSGLNLTMPQTFVASSQETEIGPARSPSPVTQQQH